MSDTLKTNGKNKTYIPSLLVTFIILVNVLLLFADFYFSNFVFVRNSDRTFSTGIFQVLWLQFPFLFILVLTNRLEFTKTKQEIIERIGIDLERTTRYPLFQETGIEVKIKDEESNTVGDIIFYLLVSDLLLMSILVFYGYFFNYLFVIASLAYQAYFLTPVLLIYNYYNRKRFYNELNNNPNIEIDVSSIFTKIVSLQKRRKYFIVGCLVFLITGLGLLWTVPFIEDFNTDEVNSMGSSEFVFSKVHYIQKNGDTTNIIATMYTQNQFGRSYPYLVHQQIKDGKLMNSTILMTIGRVNETVLDMVSKDGELYLLYHNNDYFWFKLLKVDPIKGKVAEIAFLETNETITYNYRHFLALSDNQVFVISSAYRPHIYGTASYIHYSTIGSNSSTITKVNAEAFDAIVYDNQLRLIANPRQQTSYFEMMSINLPIDSSTVQEANASVMEVISTPYPENLDGSIALNGLSLFIIGDKLFYRSINNIYSISDRRGTLYQPDLVDAQYYGRNNQFLGYAQLDDELIFNSQRYIIFLDAATLEFRYRIHALNSHYSASKTGNLFAEEGSIITSSDDGRIFYWPSDPNIIANHVIFVNTFIVLSFLLYFGGVIGILSKWREFNEILIRKNSTN